MRRYVLAYWSLVGFACAFALATCYWFYVAAIPYMGTGSLSTDTVIGISCLFGAIWTYAFAEILRGLNDTCELLSKQVGQLVETVAALDQAVALLTRSIETNHSDAST